MTLQQIKSFIAVAKCGSFNKAEETTFLTKQALKKQIDTLETELEFKLISRSSKGILLTNAGEIFYQAACDGLIQLNIVLEKCRSISQNMNQLRIGNPPHPRLLLENIFNEYAVLYPDIHLDIAITKNSLPQKILDGSLDIAEFIYRPSNLVDEIAYQKIKVMEYTCVMSDTHPLASKSIITCKDLTPYSVGMVGQANQELFQFFRSNYPEIKIQYLDNSELSNVYNVCYNHGIYISKAHFSHLLSPLVSLPLESNIKFECGVIYRKNPSPPVKNFLKLIREHYSEE